MNITIALALCVASSLAYAAAALLQRRIAAHPVAGLGRQPHWWYSLGLNATGALLHVAALRFGPLLLVQPLGLLTILMAVGVVAVEERRPVTRGEWHGLALTAAGLAVLLLMIGTPRAMSLTPTQVPVLIGVTGLTLVILHLVGRRDGASTLWAATAAGVGFGIASALTQTITIDVTDGGPLFTGTVVVATVAVAVLASASMIFTQVSYRRRFGAAVATSSLVNPVVSAGVGILLLQEGLRGGVPGVLLGVGGAVVAARGVMVLSTHPEPARVSTAA